MIVRYPIPYQPAFRRPAGPGGWIMYIIQTRRQRMQVTHALRLPVHGAEGP
jgi:hypothetical protein